jgi:hypothetical protein
MTQNQPQFVTEIRPAGHLRIGYPATTERSPQKPDDLKRRKPGKTHTAFAILLGFASLTVFPRTSAQMIVPVDRRLHPPEGFDFGGHWNCGDGSSIDI